MTTQTSSPVSADNADFGVEEIKADLRKLERRDLWAWANAVAVILVLTTAVISLSASFYFRGEKTLFGLDYRFALRALVFLILAFTLQTIFQQWRVRKLQRDLAERQIEAEVFRRLAMFDPLTGLYNRRFAEQRLRAEISRSERRGHPLLVVLLDLNDFKVINDKHGHQAGDLALKEFAHRLSSSTRGSDVAARWGGDEFIMILVDCEEEQLSRVLVRLEGFSIILHGKEIPIAIATGWKAYEPGDRLEDLIEGADRRLYYNKEITKKRPPSVLVPA